MRTGRARSVVGAALVVASWTLPGSLAAATAPPRESSPSADSAPAVSPDTDALESGRMIEGPTLLGTTDTSPPATSSPQAPPPSTASPGTVPVFTTTPSLEVSKTIDLDPTGDTVVVTGRGYDETRGVYVALCVVPPAGLAPTPCGGGIDLTGETGASQWISSDPPAYGEGLAHPYQPGGGFQVHITVRAQLNPEIDCRRFQCAVVTRSDHTRLADRSLDVIVPVFFAADPPDPDDPTVPSVTVATAVEPERSAQVLDAPTTTIGDDPVAAGDEPVLVAPRGAVAVWPVWLASGVVAVGLVAATPRRGRRRRTVARPRTPAGDRTRSEPPDDEPDLERSTR